MNRKKLYSIAASLILSSAPVLADDLTGATKLLCSSAQAAVCASQGACDVGPPWNLNIPDFIEVDLTAKLLKTTAASGENRKTPILHLEREAGNIYIQGIERQRAFSIVVTEKTGTLTAAVAREDFVVTVFGACTPATGAK
jgi:hypothetical protein